MKQIPLNSYFPNMSPIFLGCMGLGGEWGKSPFESKHVKQAHDVIDSALACGINSFDHADIYTMGKAEQVFGEVLKARPELRENILIQSKCGIVFEDEQGPKRFDFSKQYLLSSVDGILNRLNTDYIDILLLHRPDPLMDAHEVAEAFSILKNSGKVKHFGVSNQNSHQMKLLQHALEVPLVANQIELNLTHLDFLEDAVLANNPQAKDLSFATGTMEYCQLNNVQVQAWGSLCQGILTGKSLLNQPVHIQQTAALVNKLAADYQTSPEAILLAFLMRHPAKIQPIIGTTNSMRIKGCAQASQIELSREHWYSLFVTARGCELP
ncbi:aldo/keto reductase [Aliiglaciecola sp. 3_MG-2023]|uniref:aldo/keto reductase n=1 Tax=Aliiglaciecola sp. 3_MG-2023 TaxID=3062644 RepID=UPI0026E3302A|nr:aldo/keto reductase [Aliiglaciecola sp. 3_MG-2023]MDO6694902.1 aldo/keto reductase [Aliiglaciecola sp. 3_MG-2023]